MVDLFDNLDWNKKMPIGEILKMCIDTASPELKKDCKIRYYVKQLLQLYRSLYLNAYEILLIQKVNNVATQQEKETIKEHLKTYYRFLIAFNFDPLLDFKDDNDNMFYTIISTMLYADSLDIYKQVYNIVETHYSTHDELDKQIMEIACSDEDLKPQMMTLLQYSNTQRFLAMSASDLKIIFDTVI